MRTSADPIIYAFPPADHVERFTPVSECAFTSARMQAMFALAAKNKEIAARATTPPKAHKIHNTKPEAASDTVVPLKHSGRFYKI